MAAMRYIDKTIETQSGVDCSVWIATRLRVDLGVVSAASIDVCGWASAGAYLDGKPPLDKLRIPADGIEELEVDAGEGGQQSIYGLTGQAVVICILSDERFSGGSVRTFEVGD